MSLSIEEVAVSAQMNFENVVKMNPLLKSHPIFQLAMEQLQEVIDRLEKEEEE